MGGTGWSWHTALSEGYFYSETDFMMPFAIVLGLALIAIPGYKEERIARGEDISGLSGPGLITPRWWVVGAIATAAGFCNLMLLEGR